MAHIIDMQGTRYFWVSWRGPDGRRMRKSTGVPKDAADGKKRVAAELARLAEVERAGTAEARAGTFASWVPNWIDRQKSDNTRARYHCAWGAVAEFLESKGLRHPGGVRYQLARQYMDWRTGEDGGERHWNTALTELRVLGAVMQEAVRREIVLANPLQKLGLKRVPSKQKREISRAEELQIAGILAGLRECDAWMGRAFLVAMRQGCRLAETDVPIVDVDVGRKLIWFGRVKGGKPRLAPIHDDVLALAVARAKAGEERLVGLPASCPGKRFLMVLRKHGLGHLSFHCTRVTVVTRLARAGVPLAQAMEFVGHSKGEVHAIYRRLVPGDLSAALAAVTG